MLSPGIEFTKVLDEANNRVLKTYFDIEVPVYYRANCRQQCRAPKVSSSRPT